MPRGIKRKAKNGRRKVKVTLQPAANQIVGDARSTTDTCQKCEALTAAIRVLSDQQETIRHIATQIKDA